jgi:high affinity sulfate transporter 1
MAYAAVAGLPIQIGLYTAFIPPIIYAVLGTSRSLSVTSTSTIAILTAAELDRVAPGADAAQLLAASATLTLMVGAFLIAGAVTRFGFAANFISEPVLVGFKAGIGVVIIVDQIPKILGIHFDKGPFLQTLLSIVTGLPHLSVPAVTVGIATIVFAAAVEKTRPRWPAPLIAIALAITGVALFGGDRLELVGAIPAGLPPFSMPDLTLASELWTGALGIALMSFLETAATGRAFTRPDEPTPRANTELLATGAANMLGSLLSAMPGGGGMSQTAVNRLSGARTQVTGFVTAAMTLLTMLFIAPLLGRLPHAVLAGTVVVHSIGLIQPAAFREILQIRRTEFIWAMSALLGVMLLGTLRGILVAIIVSVVALAQQTANPPVYVLGRKPGTNVFRPRSAEHPEDETFPGLLLLRVAGRLFFLNAERVAESIRPLIAEAKPKVIVLDLRGVFDIEYSALKMLIEAQKRQRAAGVAVWLTGLSPEVFAAVERSALGKTLGRECLLFNLEIAVDKYLAQRVPAPGD